MRIALYTVALLLASAPPVWAGLNLALAWSSKWANLTGAEEAQMWIRCVLTLLAGISAISVIWGRRGVGASWHELVVGLCALPIANFGAT